MTTSTVAERARIEWSMRLSSAARSALACAVVGGATLYGPKFLAHHIKFSAFSYFTTVLIVSGALSLGDTLRGCWHALCATAMVVPLAMLWRWIIGPMDELPPSMAAAAVAAAAFLVALPNFTHLTAKKLAFGQIILVCTVVGANGGASDRFMQPVYIAASTALGALASLLAFMVPFPGLASHKISELCRVYAENVSQRMNIYLRASMAADEHTKMELISQAKPLSEIGVKLLQSIRLLQEGMQWERPWRRVNRGQRLERMELQMRGIEYSLLSSPAFPTQTSQHHQISHLIEAISAKLKEKIQQLSCFSPSNSVIQSESIEKPSLPLDSTLPGCVLNCFSCIEMILNDTLTPQNELQPHPKTECTTLVTLMHQRLEFSIKCSLSLGLAVLLGQLFDPDHGCYAGLAVAISFANGRQAIFTMANARAQGTAMGSVYAVMCCFLIRHEAARLTAILPWIAITSLIRYSKMYGQTGEISAAIGALLILGRKNYGIPQEFAMARLMEVFIGLSTLIVVELFLQPFRAATLAKNHLCMTLNTLQDCIIETSICHLLSIKTMREKHTLLTSLISKLRDLVGDAELEPDFWCLPFRSSCYRNMLKSLSNISDLLHFITLNFEAISEMLESVVLSEEFKERVNNELGVLQETLKQSVSTDAKEAARQQVDLEAGALTSKELPITEAEWKTEEAGENEVREMMMRQMSAAGFCISSLVKELKDIQICLRELNQWENQSSP